MKDVKKPPVRNEVWSTTCGECAVLSTREPPNNGRFVSAVIRFGGGEAMERTIVGGKYETAFHSTVLVYACPEYGS
jgi:hypothetical protein